MCACVRACVSRVCVFEWSGVPTAAWGSLAVAAAVVVVFGDRHTCTRIRRARARRDAARASQFFGPIDSVAKLVAEDEVTGYGNKELTGNGYNTFVRQGLECGLVTVRHSPRASRRVASRHGVVDSAAALCHARRDTLASPVMHRITSHAPRSHTPRHILLAARGMPRRIRS